MRHILTCKDAAGVNDHFIGEVYKLAGLKKEIFVPNKQMDSLKALYTNSVPLFKLFPDRIDRYRHAMLMEAATPEIIEAINSDKEIRLIKESMECDKKLAELWPDDPKYRERIEAGKKSILWRELRILSESKKHKDEKVPLRCRWCGKVIRHDGKNIHCTSAGSNLICDYCGHKMPTTSI